MNCNEFELMVLSLAHNQLTDAVAEPGLVHAKNCLHCAGRLASERFLAAGARAVIAEIATEEAPLRVEETLLAAFHEHYSTRTPEKITSRRITMDIWSLWRPAAVAALFLIMISTMAVFWLNSNSLNQDDGEMAGLVAPIALPGLVVETSGPRAESVDPDIPAPPAQLHRRTPRRRPNQTEMVTEFYPLIEGADFDSAEVTQVVRVELPASALSAAGLSVGPEMSTVPVKADVALGYDGLALAIRFVR